MHLQLKSARLDPWVGRAPGEGLAAHSSLIAGEFYGQRSLAGYSQWGHSQTRLSGQQAVFTFLPLHCNLKGMESERRSVSQQSPWPRPPESLPSREIQFFWLWSAHGWFCQPFAWVGILRKDGSMFQKASLRSIWKLLRRHGVFREKRWAVFVFLVHFSEFNSFIKRGRPHGYRAPPTSSPLACVSQPVASSRDSAQARHWWSGE